MKELPIRNIKSFKFIDDYLYTKINPNNKFWLEQYAIRKINNGADHTYWYVNGNELYREGIHIYFEI